MMLYSCRRSLGTVLEADLCCNSKRLGQKHAISFKSGAAGPSLWQMLRSTLEDELYDVNHCKTSTWPSHAGCTADKVLAWPEFGVDALAFMDNHRELLQSTQVLQSLRHTPALQKLSDRRRQPVTRQWQIHAALWSSIYRVVNFAAATLGLDLEWTCSAG